MYSNTPFSTYHGILHVVDIKLIVSEELHRTTNLKQFFVSVINMLLIYLFASIKL